MTSTWKGLLLAKCFFYWIIGLNFPVVRKREKGKGENEGRIQLETDQEDNKDIRKMSRELSDFKFQTSTPIKY